jgi:hypothetical protein
LQLDETLEMSAKGFPIHGEEKARASLFDYMMMKESDFETSVIVLLFPTKLFPASPVTATF